MRYWSFLVSFLRRWLGALASAQSHDPKNELDEVNAAAQRGHHGDTGDDCPPTDWLNDLARYGLGGRQTFHGDTIGGDMHFAPPGQIQDAPISKPRTDYADARTSLRTKTAPPSFAATNGRDLPRQNGLSPLRVVPVTENNAPEDLPQTRAPIRPQVIAPTHTPSITAAPTYMPIRQPIINQPEAVHQSRSIRVRSSDLIGVVMPPTQPVEPSYLHGRPTQNIEDRPTSETAPRIKASPAHPTDPIATISRPLDRLVDFDRPRIPQPAETDFGYVRGAAPPALQTTGTAGTAGTARRPPDTQRPVLASATVMPQPPIVGMPLLAIESARQPQETASSEARAGTAHCVHETDNRFPAVPVALAGTGRLEIGENLRHRLDAAARSLVWGV